MDSPVLKIVLFIGAVLGCFSLLFLAHARPGYFSNQEYIAGLVFLQVLLAAIWKFRCWFSVLLIVSFVMAGTGTPIGSGWTTGRWVVLAVGAIVGFFVFIRDHRYHFGAFHLLALFCVLAAFVSAIVSYFPQVAFLKALSLLLLFLYSSSGGRLAILGRERDFFRGLLMACEITVALTAISYFIVSIGSWGNPNSLGLVMGTVMAPLLLWGVLISESRPLRWRRASFLVIALGLLVYSNARAAMISCAIASLALCLALRQWKLMTQGAAAALILVAGLAILNSARLAEFTTSSTETLLYKGKRQGGVFGSRRSPWGQTMDVIQQHPWFGSGFGTSPSGTENMKIQITSSTTETAREHGSSYLAILEWVGMVGVAPFYALILFLLVTVIRVLAWIRRNADPFHPAVPLAAIVLAGLVHAVFEDWLFAVGYYECVFFWLCAFVLLDFAPARASSVSPARAWIPLPALAYRTGVLTSTR